ncbi:hypothetical protein ACROYT_G013166 [Oculina patagonica]
MNATTDEFFRKEQLNATKRGSSLDATDVFFWSLSEEIVAKLSKTSLEHALTSFADEVLLHMESGELCGAVFLDLSKAFNTDDHNILLSKLSAIGVSHSTLQWFKSYLSRRKQRTACSNAVSDPLPMTFGVPQGSILGPLLFLVYINDLPLAIKNCEVTLYADDTVLYYFGKEPHLLEEALNNDVLKVVHLVLPIFDYADLVWGDKDNVSLMYELQILQNKAANNC